MVSFVSYAGDMIMKIFQDSGYFDRNEISNIKSKYNPGLELQLTTTESLRKCDYDPEESFFFRKEIGILYRLKYGEIGARVMCKSYPTAQFHGTLRVLSDLAGYKLTSLCVVDIKRQKLDKVNVGLTMIAGNTSGHLNLLHDKYAFSTRHWIHPRFATLSETTFPYIVKRQSRASTVALGFQFEVNSRTSLEVMVSTYQPPTFALQFQSSNPQCEVRVSSDVQFSRTGVSIAFQPSSLF